MFVAHAVLIFGFHAIQQQAFFVRKVVGDLVLPCIEKASEGIALCGGAGVRGVFELPRLHKAAVVISAEGCEGLVALDWGDVEAGHVGVRAKGHAYMPGVVERSPGRQALWREAFELGWGIAR